MTDTASLIETLGQPALYFGLGWAACYLYTRTRAVHQPTRKRGGSDGSDGGSDSDGDSDDDGADTGEAHKMVFVVRQDLKMGKGKIAAQCCHAAIGAFATASAAAIRRWETRGCAKVALKVKTEEGMLACARACRAAGLNHIVIRDAGRTQIAPNSKTVLGIGPAPVSRINEVTGHLKLL